MKKVFAGLICVIMLSLTVMPAWAYLAGDPSWSVSADYCVEMTNAQKDGANIVMENNSSVTYEFYMKDECVAAEIGYENQSGTELTLDFGNDICHVSIDSGSGTAHCDFVIYKHKGDTRLTITATNSITITSLRFFKPDIKLYGMTNLKCTTPVSDLSEEEWAVNSSVIMGLDSTMIMVRGSKRYINYDDTSERLTTVEGKTYLPIKPLAYALGYYHEEMPDKNYALLRKGTQEYILKDGVFTRQINSAPMEELENPFIYIEGKTYAPVRFFAEELGLTVTYKDGIIVIDENKYTVANIVNTQKYMNYIIGVFQPFRAEKVEGKTYYVAQSFNASDDNPGTIDLPLATINEAAERAVKGDTVIIREGTYREILAPKNSGEPNSPIIFKAAEGERVVISALEELGTFTSYTRNGIEMAVCEYPESMDIGDGRNQIFYKGETLEALAEARYPNGEKSILPEPETGTDRGEYGDLYPDLPLENPIKIKIDSTDKDANKKAVSDTLLNQDNDYWKGATYLSLHGDGYALASAKVASSEPGVLNLTDTTIKWWRNAGVSYASENYGYIVGHINAVDIPGEWAINDGKLYVVPLTGVKPEEMKMERKARQIVADLADVNYIQLHDINTIGGGMRLNNSQMCVINGGEKRYISHFTHLMDGRDGYIDAYDVTNPNGAPPRGEIGIYLGGSDNAIVNCDMEYSAGAAIYGVGCYAYIENNVINNTGYMAGYPAGINFHTEYWKSSTTPRGGFAVLHNSLRNAGRGVMNVGVSQQYLDDDKVFPPYIPYEVAYNEFSGAMLYNRDGGITYEYGASFTNGIRNSQYHNNIVWSIRSTPADHFGGIYHDGWTNGIDTYENVIFHEKKTDKFDLSEIYISTVYSHCYIWNNSRLGYKEGGRDALEPTDFVYNKPFDAGANLTGEEYLVNYERARKNEGDYSATDAVKSDGVEMKNGVAYFTEEGQWIRFDNVDFGDGMNQLRIFFKGDMYNTKDSIEVVIGDDLENGVKRHYALESKALYVDDNNTGTLDVGVHLGKKSVWIQSVGPKSAGIDKISTYKYENPSGLATMVFGGNFTNIINKGSDSMPPEANYTTTGDAYNPHVKNTWPGTLLEYKEVVVSEAADKLVISSSSDQQHHGQTVNLRVGSPDGKIIGSFTTPYEPNSTHSWKVYLTTEWDLKEKLEPGIYDFYLEFDKSYDPEDKAPMTKTCNLYYFGFKDSTKVSADAE